MSKAFRIQRESARVDGITIIVDSLEIKDGFTYLRLAAAANALTDRLSATYRTALERWGGSAGPPPEPPELHVFRKLNPVLGDNVGTMYSLQRTAIGGGDNEWRAEWKFSPAPPEEAATLVIEISGEDTPMTSYAVKLR